MAVRNQEIRVLLAGESWVSASSHNKGWDFFSSTAYETGIRSLEAVLAGTDIQLEHLPGHLVPEKFPLSPAELSPYQVVILSDIGANSLLLHPATWVGGRAMPNRLRLLSEWVQGGGGLAMCGGYYSFAGIYGAAKYYRTPVEEVLPVNIYTFDDRVECPEGPLPGLIDADHPIVAGMPEPWPYLLGYNEVTVKPEASLIARVGKDPLLAVREVGQGRTLAWTSDIGPHWCPEPFVAWEGYGRFWRQAIAWLAR